MGTPYPDLKVVKFTNSTVTAGGSQTSEEFNLSYFLGSLSLVVKVTGDGTGKVWLLNGPTFDGRFVKPNKWGNGGEVASGLTSTGGYGGGGEYIIDMTGMVYSQLGKFLVEETGGADSITVNLGFHIQ